MYPSRRILRLVLEDISVPGLSGSQVLDSLVGVTHRPLLYPRLSYELANVRARHVYSSLNLP